MLVDSRPVVSAPVWATDGGACTGVCTCKRLKAVLCSLESLATALKHIPCTNSTRIGAMRLSVPTQQSTCPSTSTCKHAARPSRQRCVSARAAGREVTLLDYGAGNVRSVRNAIKKLGYSIKDVSSAAALMAFRLVLLARTARSNSHSCVQAAQQQPKLPKGSRSTCSRQSSHPSCHDAASLQLAAQQRI
eukprot:GHUV01020346.1.p1 GENE.GHUV01020346.1~~GHUV01020346.1.p1  ORF type:complete len:190 (+),score=35.47 GHUV01020346.1:103-672(+)